MTWATSTGSAVVGSLVPTAAEYDSTIIESGVTYGLIKYTFSGSPNLSGVLAGHRLTVAGFTNAENNGTYRVYDANDTTDEIRVYNTSRLSNSLDETGITGTGSVADAGAVITEPSTAKKAQGFLTPEKPSDGMWNWILNDLYNAVLSFFASFTAWIAEDKTGMSESYDFINGAGAFRYDPNSTVIGNADNYLEPTTGGGRGIWEAAHPDAVSTLLANDMVEILPPVVAALNFPSISSLSSATDDITVNGAADGDILIIQHPSNLDNRLYYQGDVTADDTVTITLINESGSPIDPAEGNWTVLVIKPNLMPAMTMNALRIFNNLLSSAYSSVTLETDLEDADNEAAFRILLTSTWRRKMLLTDSAIKTIIQNSATANAAMEDVEGAGY